MDNIEEETIWRPQASGQESLIDEFMEKFYTEDDRPNMIFSVIGDSNSLVPKIWPKSRFQVTLTYAAKAAGVSWILSQGEPLKISKIIREMVEEYVYLEKPNQASPIRLVSIPSKEVVDNETLYFDLPEVYENETKDEYNNSVYMSLRAHACNTDYIDFRLTFESRLHRPQANERNAVLLVLVEGDLSAVDHVRRATESGIPVVVVQGTGGAADLLAQHINAVKNGQKLDWRIFLPTLFGIQLEEVGVNELERDLETIGEKAFLVDVFDLQNKNEEEFAAMVGELVYRAWSHEEMGYVKGNRQNNTIGRSHKKVLRKDRSRSYCVSVNWKREKSTWHIAKIHETHSLTSFSSPFSLPLDFFFQFSKHLNENDSRVSEQFTETAKELLLEALLTNRTDYVEALLDLNLSLSTEQIDKLYHKRFQTNEDPSDDIKKDDLFWVIKNMAKKKNAFQLLEGNKTHLNAQKIVKQILHYEETEDPRLEAGCSTKRRKSYVVRQMSLQAILLWSLLTNKADISTLMWKRVANQLYTGIVSSVILKIMASHAELKDKNLAKSLDEHSKTFKIRALNMMDTLFQTDKKVAFNIMDSLETVWKIQATPIAFAYEFQMYDVIAHPSTVALMNKKWYRGMVPSWKQLFTKALRNPCFVFNMRCSHFVLHYILFGITLIMYSYFLLTDVKPLRNLSAKDAICEMTLYLWTTLDFINDVISVFGTLCRKVETRRHKKRKFFSRLNDMWKLFGLICFCLVIFTFSVRWKKSTKFRMVKRIAALLLLFSYLRYMRVFALRKFTGISFMFLKYMLYNLLKFLIVVAFLIIGVGVFYEALRDNSGMDMSGKWYEWSLWNILFHPFYQLFGEMFEDKFGFDGNPDKNQKTDWSVKMVAAVFMMVGNLLVISLITAFFTTTYDEVLAKSEKMWQYERYQIIMDFQDRIFANLDIVFPIFKCIRKCKKRELRVKEHFINYRHHQILQYIMAGRSMEK